MEDFERYEKERGTSKRLSAKAKEIQCQFSKVEKDYEDIDDAVSDLMNAIITSVDDEVKGTRENQIENLEEDM